MDTLIDAFNGNQAAMDTVTAAAGGMSSTLQAVIDSGRKLIPDQFLLGQEVSKTGGALQDQARRLRDASAAITPAQAAAQRFADVMGILASKTSTADQKARALEEALNILAGGTASAETAQARFTELLGGLDDRIKSTRDSTKGLNEALLDNQGRINTTSQRGAFLSQTYDQIRGALTTSASATLEAGRATGDLDGAYKKIADQTARARDAFIRTAQGMGLSRDEANKLADAYGLVPELIRTLVENPGTTQATAEILLLAASVKAVPGQKEIRTTTPLSDEAIRKLEAVGLSVIKIKDSKEVIIRANDGDFNDAVKRATAPGTKTITIKYSDTFSARGADGVRIANKYGNVLAAAYASGGVHSDIKPMAAGRATIVPPNMPRIIGDRLKDDEAYIPINNSARSRSLLGITARRMGFGLVTGEQKAASGRTVSVAPGAIVINSPFSDPALVARQTVNELARAAVA
jgi:hypothetical protein